MKANRFLTRQDDKNAFANIVPMVLSVIIIFAILFIGGYINGVIHGELNNALDSTTGGNAFNYTRLMENSTRAGLNNTSGNWDSTLNIVQVVIIITILAAAIGAIFLFTRFGR